MAETEVKTYTAKEITDLVKKKGDTTAFQELYAQMDGDFGLFTLEVFKGEEGHQSYTSPSPKNDFNKIYVGVNKASLTWQIVLKEDAPEEERNAASKGEELLTGILDRVDRQLRKRGEPSLRQGLNWLGCARGMVGLKCLIYTQAKDEKKETIIDIQPVDPLQMVWETGVDGLVWLAYLYRISKTEARARYKRELTTDEDATIIDFFDTKINAVVFSEGGAESFNNDFIKEPTDHKLGHVPVFLGFTGGMPSVSTRNNNTPTLKYRAESVWAAQRSIYAPRNKQISFIMDVAEKSVAGTLVYRSKDGKKTIKGDPFGAWSVISIAEGEELLPLMPAPVPAASAAIMAIIDRDKQESTIPFPIGYGLDPQAHSGAALAMMNDNTRSIYSPFSSLLAEAYRWLCEEILTQFKSKGQKMKLQGFDTQGTFFELEADPSDIHDDWYIRVIAEPKLPRDEAGDMQMALAATQPGRDGIPMLSRYTAREKILKLQNPMAEETRIEEQIIKQMITTMPNIQIRKAAEALVKKGDLQGAMELLASLPPPPGAGMGGQPPAGSRDRQPTTGKPLSPQELEKLAGIAQQYEAAGQPIPQEIVVALQTAKGI